jgi:hypothetical protein
VGWGLLTVPGPPPMFMFNFYLTDTAIMTRMFPPVPIRMTSKYAVRIT